MFHERRSRMDIKTVEAFGIVIVIIVLIVLFRVVVQINEKFSFLNHYFFGTDIKPKKRIKEITQEHHLSQPNKVPVLKEYNELNHRIKNNLQLIVSILNIQAKESKSNDVRNELELGQKRVVSIMLMHESLDFHYNQNAVDMDMYIYKLYSYLSDGYQIQDKNTDLILDTNAIKLKMNIALPLGIIINEFLLNSLLTSKSEVLRINISLEHDKINKQYQLSYSDSLNEEVKETDLEIVKTLLWQIKGEINIKSTGKILYQIDFPEA